MVNLPPVGRLIPTRDELNEGSVVCKLQEFDGLMTSLSRSFGRGEPLGWAVVEGPMPLLRWSWSMESQGGDVRTVSLSFKATVELIYFVGQL